MRDNKGWDFLTAFEDIDEKYIYQAAKPWKENKIVRVKRYIRVAAACIILVAAIGGGLTHQNEVKAAWYKMTSLIGRILGIEKETDEYVKTIQKTIEKNGIAVSLEEVAADAKSLWIAYSLTDEKGENDISMSSIQVAVDGESLALENQYSLDNSSGSEKVTSKYFAAKFNRSRADHSQKFEIQIGTFQNQNEQVEERDVYSFSFTADPEALQADTKEIDIQVSIPIEKNQTFLISEMKYNIFGCTISGSYSDMTEDDEFWLRGKDDLGNEYVFNLTSYDKPNLIFELQDLGISDHAKQLTLQLYHYSGTTGKTVSYEQKESEDAYIEEIGTVYDEGQAPEDQAVPVGDGITVDLQNKIGNVVGMGRRGEKNPFLDLKIE